MSNYIDPVCGPAPKVAAAYFKKSLSDHLKKVYRCVSGYSMHGYDTVECINGVWGQQGSLPQCVHRFDNNEVNSVINIFETVNDSKSKALYMYMYVIKIALSVQKSNFN